MLLLYGWVLRLVRLAEALLQLPQACLHLLEAGQIRLRQGLLGQGQLLAELAVQLGILGPGLGAPGLLLPGQLPQLLDGLGSELLRPPVGADLDIGDVVLQGLILLRLGTELLRFLLELRGLLL